MEGMALYIIRKEKVRIERTRFYEKREAIAMDYRTIYRGKEIRRRIKCYKRRNTMGTVSFFIVLCLLMISCLESVMERNEIRD